MDDLGDKVILGPGPERWPGSPQKDVESVIAPIVPTAESDPNLPPKVDKQGDKRRAVLRLKVISSVQMAALLFSEDEIRQMVEQAISNVRNRNDYS